MSGHRSYSAVNTLLRCGEQYRLERVEYVSQQPGSAAVAGGVIHSISEDIDRNIHNDDTRDMLDIYQDPDYINEYVDEAIKERRTPDYPDPTSWTSFGRRTKANPNGEDIEWFRREGIPTAVENYLNWRKAHDYLEPMVFPSGEVGIEIPFDITIGTSDPIHGMIDRVFKNNQNGALYILDIKSGAKPKSTLQLGIYRKALMTAMPDLDWTYGGYLYGLKKDMKQTPDINLTYWTTERLAKIYGQADFLINNNIFIPNPGEACFLCPVKKHCDFFQATIF